MRKIFISFKQNSLCPSREAVRRILAVTGIFQLRLSKTECQKFCVAHERPNIIAVFCNSVALFVTALSLCGGTAFHLRRYFFLKLFKEEIS